MKYEIAGALSSGIIAVGTSTGAVHVRDIDIDDYGKTLHTNFQFGGRRLAVFSNELAFATGNYLTGEVSHFSAENEKLNANWTATGLKSVQAIRPNLKESNLFCSLGEKRMIVLSSADGSEVKRIERVHGIYESQPDGPVALIRSNKVDIVDAMYEASLRSIRCGQVLDLAFSTDVVAIAIVREGIRFVNIHTGREYAPFFSPIGSHVVRIVYVPHMNAFSGVLFYFDSSNTSFKLLKFAVDGESWSQVAEIGRPQSFTFCKEGTSLVAVDGRVWDTETGKMQRVGHWQGDTFA